MSHLYRTSVNRITGETKSTPNRTPTDLATRRSKLDSSCLEATLLPILSWMGTNAREYPMLSTKIARICIALITASTSTWLGMPVQGQPPPDVHASQSAPCAGWEPSGPDAFWHPATKCRLWREDKAKGSLSIDTLIEVWWQRFLSIPQAVVLSDATGYCASRAGSLLIIHYQDRYGMILALPPAAACAEVGNPRCEFVRFIFGEGPANDPEVLEAWQCALNQLPLCD